LIEPKSAKGKPGDTLEYTITLSWEPKEWEGQLDVSIILSAAGFEKRFELLPINTKGLTPPLSKKISFEIPQNIPPVTYTAEVVVSADSVSSSDKTSLSVSTPGFEAILVVIAMLIVVRRFGR
jgi:uncharacterized membrane protein